MQDDTDFTTGQQIDKKTVSKKINITDHNWTLLLDRDGVINHQKEDGYILSWDEFVLYEGVLEALQIFSKKFRYIFIVTNQRGVGRGLMQMEDLNNIHHQLKLIIENTGGRLDHIYFCTDTEAASPNRKPNAGMGLQAKKDYPEIDFNKCIMVGNSLSDMEFGRKIGAKTVFLTTTKQDMDISDERIDDLYPTLIAFAKVI